MNDAYYEMLRQTLKASGMTDKQIEDTIKAQKAALETAAKMAPAVNARLQEDIQGLKTTNSDSVAAKMYRQPGMQDMMSGAVSALQMQANIAGIDMNSYFEFSKPSSLDKNDQWAVACGADLIHLRADIINDLTTGADKETAVSVLANDWGIENKAGFIEMAESLLKGRHSKIYNQFAEGKNVKDYEEEAANLKEALEAFSAAKLIKGKKAPDMFIWDLGRLINISRLAFDAGILKREEALKYIRAAAKEVKKNYSSWKDVSIGYQFGRAVWGGLEQFEEMKEGMKQLLTEKDSPWVTLPFDMDVKF
ncbi:MAG: DUF1266 domain-containing protein [Elusimicrobia bacterium]|nr:DUF1266 domain-containing protein [Elusimicrobiota bacterium]